jgi:hypothetical protein
MLSAEVSLEKALGAFGKMCGTDPALPLKAMGFFKGGDAIASKDRSGNPAFGTRSGCRYTGLVPDPRIARRLRWRVSSSLTAS